MSESQNSETSKIYTGAESETPKSQSQPTLNKSKDRQEIGRQKAGRREVGRREVGRQEVGRQEIG